MHKLQIMLVEAENAEEAISLVSGLLSNEDGVPQPNWSDWHEIGGRWSGHFNGEDAVPYSSAIGRIKLNEAVEERKAAIASLYERVKNFDLKSAVEKYDAFAHSSDSEWKAWELRKLAGLLDDTWLPESGVYDLNDWTANLKPFKGRCELAPEMQYLVAVDFHY